MGAFYSKPNEIVKQDEPKDYSHTLLEIIHKYIHTKDIAKIILEYVQFSSVLCNTLTWKGVYIKCLAYLENGDLACGCCYTTNHNVKIIRDSKHIMSLVGHTGIIYCLLVLQNGDLVSSSEDNTIKIWRNYKCEYTLSGHKHGVEHLAVLKNGNLVSATYNTIKIWKNYICINTIPVPTSISLSCLTILPNDDIVTGSLSTRITIWRNYKSVISWSDRNTSDTRCIITLPNGDFACGGDSGIIRIWRYSKYENINNVGVRYDCIMTLVGHKSYITCLTSLSNGDIVSGSFDNTIKIWRNGECIKTFDESSRNNQVHIRNCIAVKATGTHAESVIYCCEESNNSYIKFLG